MYRLVDLEEVRFHVHTHSPSTVEIPGFEPKQPPVFAKTADTSIPGAVVG